MWWHCCKTKLPRGFLADNFPQWKAIKTLPPSLFLARRKQNRNVRRSNEVSRTLKRLLRNIWSLKDIHQKNWESTSSWKQIHTCASFLALRKRANMEISIRLIAGGIPARAPLLIKPSAEDRTLIKKPCRTVVPLNRGSGRAIAFFFFPSVVRLYLTALKAKTHECWTLRRRQSDILTVRSAVIKHRGRPGKTRAKTSLTCWTALILNTL